ncbi:MAG: sulfite oxidase-like oxidoreductase [Thermoplasmatota archaeon]
MAKLDQSSYPVARIPPGQFITGNFPVLHAGSVPRFDPMKWDLRVYGAVENPVKLSYSEVRAMPTKRVLVDIHCVTTWSKLDTAWEGVPLTHIMDVVKPKPSAKFVVFDCEEGFTVNNHIEDCRKPNSLLAYKYDGKDLAPEHGFPLRGLIPHRYFWKSGKWVRGVRFEENDEPGFWEVRGYHNNADYWKEERYSFEGDQSLRPMPAQGEPGVPAPDRPDRGY